VAKFSLGSFGIPDNMRLPVGAQSAAMAHLLLLTLLLSLCMPATAMVGGSQIDLAEIGAGDVGDAIEQRKQAVTRVERLLGDAANSPLVTVRGSPNQTTVGIGASYSFDFKIR